MPILGILHCARARPSRIPTSRLNRGTTTGNLAPLRRVQTAAQSRGRYSFVKAFCRGQA